ncbi:uncharacterized protein KY384_002502 [Bacidia gigantensis]|uniref:uncharacterized protein n=1 Tax=Bacidia gigantensis TaxID=2732470 RepID=UPI001D041C7D|nr:uncharacterized protein KY384_002502 [Bacidia gigantensis]KAG8532625.1 hypothetical protein KY384_002502 [Bacidia gigantensis]
MGQEQSALVSGKVPSQTLTDRSVESIAKHIKDGYATKIVVMVGAGISTSAGIPDFRSPDTGLYANLARLNLPYAEAVFDISFFRSNPLPFYTLAHELYPGKYQPTLAHSFIRLLADKGLLMKLFTQNIDCLDREAGVPADKIVEAHGSFASQRCIECKDPFPLNKMKEAIASRAVPHCHNARCNGLVKPDIVFFGEALPKEFHANRALVCEADLCIIMGTSLTVQPFASLPGLCQDGVPRLLINLERVGGLGARTDDVLLLGDCDAGVRRLAESLNWMEELEDIMSPAKPSTLKNTSTVNQLLRPRNETLEDEITKLTTEVDQSLKISNDHVTFLRANIAQYEHDSQGSDIHTSKDHNTLDQNSGAPGNIDKPPLLSNPHHRALGSKENDSTPGQSHERPPQYSQK